MVALNENIIYPNELRNLAGIVLRTLDEQKILSSKDLKNNLGKKFSIKEFSEDNIEILEGPSLYKTKSLILAYNREDTGVIINAVLNEQSKYSQVIIKGQFGVEKYTPLVWDMFGNLVMDKHVLSKEFSEIRKELQELTNPKNYISF